MNIFGAKGHVVKHEPYKVDISVAVDNTMRLIHRYDTAMQNRGERILYLKRVRNQLNTMIKEL